MKCFRSAVIAAASLALGAASAPAVMLYEATLTPLNGSGVSGLAALVLDGDMLTVTITAEGLEPNQTHAQHIHGLFDMGSGDPSDSTTPTIADDADGDGFIEVLEGVPAYGDVLLPLTSPPPSNNDAGTAVFPVAPSTGTLVFSATYNLADEGQFFSPVTGTDYDGQDLLPLQFREIVLHGMTVDGSAGAGTDGEIDGAAGYKASLPVASGEIVLAVPEPTSLAACFAALAAVAGLGRRR